MANVEVYVVTGSTIPDDYSGCAETWIVSLHATREAAIAAAVAKKIAQLQEQLDAVREKPCYSPQLRFDWHVQKHVLES